MIVSRPRSVR